MAHGSIVADEKTGFYSTLYIAGVINRLPVSYIIGQLFMRLILPT